ncbi:hypothetical protein HX035_24485 [Escherichia coli]|nr:hypothetical protein [Escherichia coli]
MNEAVADMPCVEKIENAIMGTIMSEMHKEVEIHDRQTLDALKKNSDNNLLAYDYNFAHECYPQTITKEKEGMNDALCQKMVPANETLQHVHIKEKV